MFLLACATNNYLIFLLHVASIVSLHIYNGRRAPQMGYHFFRSEPIASANNFSKLSAKKASKNNYIKMGTPELSMIQKFVKYVRILIPTNENPTGSISDITRPIVRNWMNVISYFYPYKYDMGRQKIVKCQGKFRKLFLAFSLLFVGFITSVYFCGEIYFALNLPERKGNLYFNSVSTVALLLSCTALSNIRKLDFLSTAISETWVLDSRFSSNSTADCLNL